MGGDDELVFGGPTWTWSEMCGGGELCPRCDGYGEVLAVEDTMCGEDIYIPCDLCGGDGSCVGCDDCE